ncbi:MAG: sigma-70 family RNA polymerase sigma factor [Chloroflexia bacterium]|nr:sigma-70 family RNA polymerase sigma factor [Chloroflexia bacterium]
MASNSDRAQEERAAIERVLAGDQNAYSLLVERYGGSLYRYVHRMVHDPDEAQDLVQEAFLRAYLSLASYDPTYRFSTWLFRIATNLALNYIKASRRVISLESLTKDQDAPPVEFPDTSAAAHPEEQVERCELAELVQKCIEDLPPAYRVVVALRHVAELSYAEIASSADLPLNTVRSRLHRGRERLGECLEEHLPEEERP